MVRKARTAQLVPLVLRDRKVSQGPLAPLAPLVLLVRSVRQVRQVRQVQQVRQVPKVLSAPLVRRVLSAPQVP